MALVVLAQGNSNGGGSGDIFQVSLTQLASLALNISIGQVSESQLEGLINPGAWQAEANQPEGAQIEFNISGWTIFGTDYSQSIADQINSYWSQGQFTVNGETLQPWPGATQIAYGGNDTVTMHYLKGQFFILWLCVGLAVAVWLYNLLTAFTGGHTWSILGLGASTSSGTNKGWWASLPLWEKMGFFGAGIVIAGGLVLFMAERSIAEAGAPRSETYIGR